MSDVLSAIVDGRWQPSVGDPTVVGWAIFAAYVAAAVLCVRCALNRPGEFYRNRQKKYRTFWWVVAIVLVLLAVNKQLDLHAWLTAVARKMAKEQGWYGRHRTVQLWFVSAVGIAGLCIIAAGMWLMRPLRGCRLAFVGLVILLVFIVTRAASFGRLDSVMSLKYLGLKVRHLVELTGIVCIAVSAAVTSIRLHKGGHVKVPDTSDYAGVS